MQKACLLHKRIQKEADSIGSLIHSLNNLVNDTKIEARIAETEASNAETEVNRAKKEMAEAESTDNTNKIISAKHFLKTSKIMAEIKRG